MSMNTKPPVLNDDLMAYANVRYGVDVRAVSLQRGKIMSIAVADDASHTALYGEGGGSVLNVSGGGASVFIPLYGCLAVHTPSFVMPLRTGELAITEPDNQVRVVGHGRAKWLALLAGKQAWQRMLGGSRSGHTFDARLLPAHHTATRGLRRNAIVLARAETAPRREIAAQVVLYELVALQAPLHEAVSRCPGRTHAKRLNVFLRMQRVHTFISYCCDRSLDNDVLARMANYSPCHFLRTFNQVFRETPHNCLINARLQRAMHLLRSSELPINEIAMASGFENRSAFSRSFRERFGVPANKLRRRGAGYGEQDTRANPRHNSATAAACSASMMAGTS